MIHSGIFGGSASAFGFGAAAYMQQWVTLKSKYTTTNYMYLRENIDKKSFRQRR